MSHGVVFFHGAGRHGRDAWPQQLAWEAERRCRWLDRREPGDPPEAMAHRVIEELDESTHVVAHSYGALAAVLLAERRPDLVRSLILIEPALLALASGQPHTRAHIEALDPVFASAGDPGTSDLAFLQGFALANGLTVPDAAAEEVTAMARQVRATVPPWQVSVDATVVGRTPTLVVTGSDDSMYTEVARELESLGARRARLPVPGHRPHDHAEFDLVARRFWEDLG